MGWLQSFFWVDCEYQYRLKLIQALCADQDSVIITNIIRMISVYPPNGAPCEPLLDHYRDV